MRESRIGQSDRKQMDISVVVCTYNRCVSLATALDSISAQSLSHSITWEVIVVDNNSTDQTASVVKDFERRTQGRFRYVFERQQGLSRARNAGIAAAQGEVIAFVDDDVIAEPSWLSNLTAPFWERNASGAGGRIVPPPDFTPPDWFTVGGDMDLLGAVVPVFNLGEEVCQMKRPPYGANMAFRRSMFQKYGLFRVDLGRCGESLVMGEDIEFGHRLMEAGETLWYNPSAIVEHPVPKERLTKKHFRAWWYDFGRTRIIERGVRSSRGGIPGEYFSMAMLLMRFLPLRVLRWLLASQPRIRFYRECQIWLTLGEVAQNYRNSLRPRTGTLSVQGSLEK
jgi:glucosyl-dolichyl phosphate glucuronosyltransferase